jgi:thioredoxin 2
MSTVVACPNCGKKNRVPAAASGSPQCANCHRPLPWSADADDTTFANVAGSSTLPVLLDLWAPWCGPCRMVSPALETLARENAGSVKLVKVNVDEAPGVARRFDARSIPTLVVLQGDHEIARQIGAAPEPALRRWLSDALAAAKTSSKP